LPSRQGFRNIRQLGDIRREPPCLVLGEHLGRCLSALISAAGSKKLSVRTGESDIEKFAIDSQAFAVDED